MIGKSYDGTLSNGVAATGVEGLKTIVPVTAISAWYNYSRTGGVRHNTNYPGSSLNPTDHRGRHQHHARRHASRTAARSAPPVNNDINNDANVDTGDGDAHGDINTFWRDRDYNVNDATKIKASVFATHGFQDDNVRMDQIGMWWDTLGKAGVERKLWLLRAGHTDPFESRRAVWVDTLHRWFDHYLYGVDNGIEKEPAVTVEEEAKDVWKDYTSWPIDGTQNVDLFLRATDDVAARRHARRHRRAARPTRSASPLARNTSETHADEHADRLAGQPPRVPVAHADQGRRVSPARRWRTSPPRSAPRRATSPC